MNDYAKLRKILRDEDIDCVDFGCSTGGSIVFAQQHFGAKNVIGIDISSDKVRQTKEKGYAAIQGDLTSLPPIGEKVRFSILSHFLEHVPSVKMAEDCIRSAVNISEDFVYIQQPYFDADSYLFSKGYKFYWSDWHGHPNKMTQLEFHNILRRFKEKGLIHRFVMYGLKTVTDSHDTTIHPIASPMDQQAWDPKIHPPKSKTKTKFRFPIYHEIKVLIALKDHDTIEQMQKKFQWTDVLFDSQ